VDPAAAALEREDRVRRGREQVAVVRDDEHGLVGRRDLVLERLLARHVEEVVGLVEQQHLGVRAEQHVEHEPLALAARERRRVALGDVVERAEHDAA
jgi:hypothetical protein